MDHMVTRSGPPTPPDGMVTVAELVNRTAGGPEAQEPPAAVSVGTLLRREGRAPHAFDRPVQARVSQQALLPAVPPAPGRVRRAAVAAGTFVAVGSVLGAAVLTDATGLNVQGMLDGYPGQGRLDQDATDPPPTTTVIGVAAMPSPLDPGVESSLVWPGLGIPGAGALGAAAGVPADTSGGVGASPARSGTGAAGPGSAGGSTAGGPALAAPGSGLPASGTTGSGTTGGSGTPASDPDGTGSLPAPVQDVAAGVGGTVGTVVDKVGPVAAPITKTVPGATGTVDKVVEKAAPVTKPVTGAVDKVVEKADPITKPVTGAVGKVVEKAAPVTDVVGGATGAVGKLTGQSVDDGPVSTVQRLVAPVANVVPLADVEESGGDGKDRGRADGVLGGGLSALGIGDRGDSTSSSTSEKSEKESERDRADSGKGDDDAKLFSFGRGRSADSDGDSDSGSDDKKSTSKHSLIGAGFARLLG